MILSLARLYSGRCLGHFRLTVGIPKPCPEMLLCPKPREPVGRNEGMLTALVVLGDFIPSLQGDSLSSRE